MTSSTLSKLLCAIICNKCLSPPNPAPPAPLDGRPDPVPLKRPRFPPILASPGGGPKSEPFEEANVDQVGKLLFWVGGAPRDVVNWISNNGESCGETMAR